MAQDHQAVLTCLLARIASMEAVRSVGVSGGMTPFPKAGEGDVDVFIYCASIPGAGERASAMGEGVGPQCAVNVLTGGHWGVGDRALIGGVEVWLMYFTVGEAEAEVAAILQGLYPDRVDNGYYPIGRCAMLRDIRIVHDKDGFLCSMKQRLSPYPEELARTLAGYHLRRLEDREDLTRAVLRRDVLFYHFALDRALDHFLQTLFALNRTYFPSRKRSLDHIGHFERLPEDCGERLLEAVKLGGCADTLEESCRRWDGLVHELGCLR